MNIKTMIKNRVIENKDWIVNIRRQLHKIPELDFNLPMTIKLVTKILDELGVKYHTKIGKSGIVAEIEGKDRSKTIALRADMDALPILECGNSEYKSTIDGQMHACGHDAHTAILLGVAKILSENKEFIPCNIRLIFQPAEETTGGALPMIKDGCLENVDMIFGLHVDPELEVGKIGIKYGVYYASSSDVEIKITGKSSHGASPDKGIDAIVTACAVITSLQSIVSRNIDSRDSVVLSFGKIEGGEKENIIAQKVVCSGTIRALSQQNMEFAKTRIKEMVENISSGYGAKGEVYYKDSYRALINHDNCVDIVIESAREYIGDNNVFLKGRANMGVEDFAYYLEKIPGAFFNLGVRNETKGITASLHNDRFDIDEDGLVVGITMQILNILNAYESIK